MSKFDYKRSARYFTRTITNLASTITSGVTKPSTADNVNEVRVSMEELASDYEAFKAVVKKGLELVEGENAAAITAAEDSIMADQETVTNISRSALAKARTYIYEFEGLRTRESMNSSFGNSSLVNDATVKLPKIDVPSYDGVTGDFLDFSALYENLVHNEPSLNKVQKLFYLKKALTGEAYDLVKSMPLTERGYDEAWGLVRSTYYDVKAIMRKHFDNLFAIPRIKSISEVPNLLAKVNQSLKGLQACGENTEPWSSIICYMVSERLDDDTFVDFEKTLTTNTVFPTWTSLRSFLENLSSVAKRSKPSVNNRGSSNRGQGSKTKPLAALTTDTPPRSSLGKSLQCVSCSQSHLLINCEDFKSKSPRQRFDLLKDKAICRNCFNSGHRTSKCSKSPHCLKCKQSHHTMLHFDEEKPIKSQSDEDSKPNGESNLTAATVSVRKSVVLLPTALVNFKSGTKTGNVRLLLDSCSQVNLISASFVNHFKLSKGQSSQRVSGINGSESVCDGSVSLTLSSKTESFSFDTSFNVIPSKIPYSVSGIGRCDFKCDLSRYKLADPIYYNSHISISDVDALIGIEAYNLIVRGSVVNVGNICLRDTSFGWTLSSSGVPNVSELNSNADENYCGLTMVDIDRRLQQFWEVEEIPHASPISCEAEACNKHFESTYTRNIDGQFVVKLPFKQAPSCIVGNYNQALSFSHRSQSRLKEPISSMYSDFMVEYANLEHMTKVSNNDANLRHFIPHHAVLKMSSTTTKLRTVFNASCKVPTSNLSLNDILMIGPTIQPELFDQLLSFRMFRYALTGDIMKMYRCILVDEQDRRYQSIVWGNEVYELNTVTYGTRPASFQATKCLKVLSDLHKVSEPVASAIISDDFYIDDLMTGADTAAELIKNRNDVHRILASAGFILRKYQTNSIEVLNSIEPELRESNLSVTFGENESLSILGLAWAPSADSFYLKVNIDIPTGMVTKRFILSTVSKLFDPLGFVSPIVIRGKLLLKRLWELKLNWDDPVPDDVSRDFYLYVQDIMELRKVAYPRFVGTASTSYLVGFCDASKLAYCAVVYVVTEENGKLRSSLYCSKTRVAPVKTLTIPQLELQAALLLADLVFRIQNTFKVDRECIRLYSDSTIVLSWLKRSFDEWKTFVRNRVSKIVPKFPSQHWFYVNTKQNPADIATRGTTTEKLLDSSLWKSGPEFILSKELNDGLFEVDPLCEAYLAKPKAVTLLVSEDISDMKIIESFSSYYKLIRLYAAPKACYRRWKSKLQSEVPENPNITSGDIAAAELHLIRVVQVTQFPDEYKRLKANRKLSKRSPLRNFEPFIDENGIMRSRSRLQKANVSFDRKNPIILPAKGHFAMIFIDYVHERYFHVGRSFLLTYLSLKFIFSGSLLRTIKLVLSQCVICRRFDFSGHPKPQLMADLPADRVKYTFPFSVVGVDFTGAFTVKCNFHRMVKYVKVYAAVFVCFVTRAIHIEIVPSLSTEDFLSAFKCFIARRGLPSTIYSDNGTNFRGADRYLNFRDASIGRFAAQNGIHWIFNPPYTPHRGGIWEAAVKSAKRFIPKVTKGQILTEFELRVLLTQIEAILNSRPIAPPKDSSEEILTPGHFLIGRNLCSLPEPHSSGTIRLSDRYRANQQRIRSFWRLWSTDYINQFRTRSKWLDPQPNPVEGQIVFYKDPNSLPYQWPVARINRCFPDSAGLVRTVELRIGNQLKIVPTHHIVPI